MDAEAQSDGIFIGRYVEVEYDDPPITGYKLNNVFYSDAEHTKALTPVNGRIYQDLHQVNTTGSFYIYESRTNTYTVPSPKDLTTPLLSTVAISLLLE